MVIFFPLTNLVDVDVLFTLALLGVAPFIALKVLNEVLKPPTWRPVLKKSSMKSPVPKRLKGENKEVLRA